MTFDEWFAKDWPGDEWSYDAESIRGYVRAAWEAATAFERERCAILVEGCEAADMGYTVQLGGEDDGEGYFVPDEGLIARAIRGVANPPESVS